MCTMNTKKTFTLKQYICLLIWPFIFIFYHSQPSEIDLAKIQETTNQLLLRYAIHIVRVSHVIDMVRPTYIVKFALKLSEIGPV